MDAKELISEAIAEQSELYDHVRDAANWFHEREGTFLERDDAINRLASDLNIEKRVASNLISELVSDVVDPVVQVMVSGQKHVGIVEYVEGEGWYGYSDFDDLKGERKRIVCAQCVHDATYDHEVVHATAGEGSFTDQPSADYDVLVAAIENHYEEAHNGVVPEDVETGASLLSGTTIGGNTAWHSGNDGGSSGLDADTVDGSHAADMGIPSGTITMWSGSIASIPSGWVLCDGNNGTPNLQDKFVVGAGSGYSVGSTGGEASHTLTESEMPSHGHDIRTNRDSGCSNNYLSVGGNRCTSRHSGNAIYHTGGDSAHENRPPYHALAYIMKV